MKNSKRIQIVVEVNDDTLSGLAMLMHQDTASDTLLRAFLKDRMESICQKLTKAGQKREMAEIESRTAPKNES
jgi:hypothetical protein